MPACSSSTTIRTSRATYVSFLRIFFALTLAGVPIGCS
jgi:hypothetical protein